MSWFNSDWQSDPDAVETQRELTRALLGRDAPERVSWREIKRYVTEYVDAVKSLHKRIADMESGKHVHAWRDAWVAGAQETRCTTCGVSIADIGAVTLIELKAKQETKS
jgi:hypothetical protein